jgi:prepilin-type processing-associated H-X9-DG protein
MSGTLLILAFLIVSYVLPHLDRAADPISRAEICASHLRQIGEAIRLYVNDNHGQYPGTLGALVLTEDIDPSAFVCPASKEAQSSAPTTRQCASQIDSGLCCSYIYCGEGLTSASVTPDTVIAYESPSHNHNGVTNFLFGDGRVEYLMPSEVSQVLANIAKSTGPPQSQATAK